MKSLEVYEAEILKLKKLIKYQNDLMLVKFGPSGYCLTKDERMKLEEIQKIANEMSPIHLNKV